MHQDVQVVSGHGPQLTQPNGALMMPFAAANLAAASHVLNLLLTILPMATPAVLFRTMTVPMTQGALAAIGLGLL